MNRLPRSMESDSDTATLLRGMQRSAQPLWRASDLATPVARSTPEFERALLDAHVAGRVVRGLEEAERRLAIEERGLRAVEARLRSPRGGRVSRLLLLSDDGAERFYRNVESILRRHQPRVLAVRLELDALALGSLLFGAGRRTRALLLEHKDAVSSVLRALAPQWQALAETP